MSGEKVKDELMKSLANIKNELMRQHMNNIDTNHYMNFINDRVCVASQTDLCSENIFSGARLAEMAKIKLQYNEWRNRIKELQQQLFLHADRIEPGQLESDKDRLLLIQEKKNYLRELQSISQNAKTREDEETIKQQCKILEEDLNNAYEYSNQCIAMRLRKHEEKELLLQQLRDALKSTKLLEDRLKSFSSGSTFSISSGSSLGSLSTSSSKNSLSALSFTDIYGDPFTSDLQYSEVSDLHRKAQRFSQPFDLSISPRSSMSVDTPPASPLKDTDMTRTEEPTYENMRSLAANQELNAILNRLLLDDRLLELKGKEAMALPPLSPIYEKASLMDIPQVALSRSSSASNTRSVSAAVSNESVAGDSGVFEASRPNFSNSEAAQIQIAIKYLLNESLLYLTIERARNLKILTRNDYDSM